MAFGIRGQGSTEYLVLLAVVLVVALVSVGLLGFFPGMSTDAKMAQSASYWKGAKPFAIIEHSMTASASNGTLVIQNMDSTGTITLNTITLTGSGGSGTAITTTPNYAFAPGEMIKMPVNISVGAGVAAGRTYDLQVTINYTTSNDLRSTQYGGSKTLTGKYI
jgi:uncharacterized protein (UPF0333 family)